MKKILTKICSHLQLTKKVPVIFHNLRGYDSLFDVKIDVIPSRLEKYMGFILNKNLVFIDSMQFMNSSLEKLVKNLSNNDFKQLTQEFGSKNLELFRQKDAYPYEYMNGFKRFSKKKLPDKKCFYRSLKDGTTGGDSGKKLIGHISDEEYKRCIKIWNKFNMENMGNYHDHYVKKDVLLLADVFENFFDTCLNFYKLDPCHYFSSPGLSWDAMLKMTGIKCKKISDMDMYLFIEKVLRGGISNIGKIYSEANNKYMKNYDSTKPSKYISYLDMNNFYGKGMSGYLPYRGFKWLENVDNFDVNSINKNSSIGYILEIDLEHPDKLHKLHNDYRLAPENLAIPYEILSDYCKKIAEEYGIKVGDVKKLIPNLGNKTNYVAHYRNLQFYLSLGIKLTKIHKILKFKQSDQMKNYIDFNTEKRTKATNKFEKNVFKLMINSVYGKTIENLRKRISVKIVKNEKHETCQHTNFYFYKNV